MLRSMLFGGLLIALQGMLLLPQLAGRSHAEQPARSPSPDLRVRVLDGREFAGKIDPRTDDEKLCLRRECGGASLTRPIAWHVIQEIRRGDESIGVDALRQQYRGQLAPPVELDCAGRASNAPAPAPAPRVLSSSADVPRVRSIEVDARLANFDSDVEHDGLWVTVAPIDQNGNLLAVDGTVEARLIGEGPATTAQTSTFPLLGRWVEPLRAEQFTPLGGRVKLWFQADLPEFDLRLGPYALLNVRFAAPGHGTFETTTEVLTVRPFNPIRDRLEQQTGRRFFSLEQTRREGK